MYCQYVSFWVYVLLFDARYIYSRSILYLVIHTLYNRRNKNVYTIICPFKFKLFSTHCYIIVVQEYALPNPSHTRLHTMWHHKPFSNSTLYNGNQSIILSYFHTIIHIYRNRNIENRDTAS